MGVGLGRAYVGRSFRASPSGDIHTSNMYHCMTLSRSNNTTCTYMYKISYDGEADMITHVRLPCDIYLDI